MRQTVIPFQSEAPLLFLFTTRNMMVITTGTANPISAPVMRVFLMRVLRSSRDCLYLERTSCEDSIFEISIAWDGFLSDGMSVDNKTSINSPSLAGKTA